MKKLFYIDFPQEHLEGQLHKYRCSYCKKETTTINGKLEGHLPSCEYRIRLENVGYEAEVIDASKTLVSHDADDFD
jgi:DNA-directed RNA polymerase subunit RPC12/RpoP